MTQSAEGAFLGGNSHIKFFNYNINVTKDNYVDHPYQNFLSQWHDLLRNENEQKWSRLFRQELNLAPHTGSAN